MSLLTEELARQRCRELLADSHHEALAARARRLRRAARLVHKAERLTAREESRPALHPRTRARPA
jgi:hypothetical protein